MRLRKQLEILQRIVTEAREHRSRAVLLERLARKLARAWDAEERAGIRAPKLPPFPRAGGELAATGELPDPSAEPEAPSDG